MNDKSIIDLTGKRCLVTGASGFIGEHLCKELVKQGAVVIQLLHSNKHVKNQSSFVCNLGEEDIPDKYFRDIYIIFHLAGRAHSLSDGDAEDALYYKTNVEGTRNLLMGARNANISKFVYFSSVKSMGEENDVRLNEASIAHPVTVYGKSKLEAEQIVLDGDYVSSPTVLRLTMVYGNSNKGNLPKLIKAISKSWFPPFPRIENKRSMVHVEDVVQCAILVASNDISSGKTYIVSDGIDYSTRKVYEVIRKSLGKSVPSWGIPVIMLIILAKFGDLLKMFAGRRILFDSDNLQKLIGNSYFSSKKIEVDLGFSPKHNLFNSIPDIITSLKNK